MSEKWSGEKKAALVWVLLIKTITYAVVAFVILAVLQAMFHFV